MGVRLVAGFGGGVAEADVVACVLSREHDDASAVDAGGGDVAVSVDGGHDPLVAVADELAGRRDKRAVVATRGDEIADPGADAVCGVGAAGSIELTALPASGLDAVIDQVDVLVAGGRDRQRLAVVAALDLVCGDRLEVLVEIAGQDAVVGSVGVERSGVAVSQLQ